MKFATLALSAVAAMLPSLATASPWTTLGRLDALTAPPLATCNQRVINHYAPAKPIHVPVSATYAANGDARLTFSGDYATLQPLSAGETAFASAVTALAQTTSVPGTTPPAPAGYLLMVVNGQPLYVGMAPTGYRIDPANPLRAIAPPPAGYTIDPANPTTAFRVLPSGQREVIVLPVIMRPTLAVPPAQPIPVIAKDLSVVVQTGLNASVVFNVGLVQDNGRVDTRSFAVTRAALRNFELQQSCPL